MVELGWTALAVPETAGGVGMKMVGVAALAEEIGRAALPSPLVATLVATLALRAAGATGADAWLERIAGGAAASLAITDARGAWEPDATRRHRAQRRRGSCSSGAAHVRAGRAQGRLLRRLGARATSGVVLYAVPADARRASRSSRITSST